ncbi:MAG TPA: BatD family protein, partial [Candidatus Acidoferrum sp.]|nr:BatD family protein [Candidatus Acidoferrum sp.]
VHRYKAKDLRQKMTVNRQFSRCFAQRFALSVAMLCLFGLTANGATVTATIDRPAISLGESVTLTLSVEGGQIGRPNLPAIPNFNLGPSTGVSTSIVNGQVRQSFTYDLIPTQAGDIVIPSLQLNVGGQISATQPITVKVLKPGEATPGGALPPAFAKIIAPKTNLYVGEVIEIQVQVYSQEGRINQYPQLPADSGFTIGKWLKPTEQRVALSNQGYTLITFRVPIVAVKAGALSIGPATQPIIVPDRGRRADVFFGTAQKEIRVIAEKVSAVALPLPSNNVPATFSGAVGEYAVTATAAPTSVAVGDPITVRVQVNGRGWLDAVTIPPQPQWRDFKMYAPNAKVEGQDQNNFSGTKMFEIPVVPQTVAIKTLPPFAFSYFDPDAATYKTITTPAIPLNVSASAGGTTPLPQLTATNTTEPTPMSDIAHIKVNPGAAMISAPLITRPWFIALQLVAPALWLGLLVRRKRTESLANNPKLRRRREVQALVRDSLARLREHAAANRSDEYFATLFRALQEQIGERLDVPANSVTESVIDERLRPAGLTDVTCRSLHELFQAANLARYAPVKSSHELNVLTSTAEGVLRELQQWERTR